QALHRSRPNRRRPQAPRRERGLHPQLEARGAARPRLPRRGGQLPAPARGAGIPAHHPAARAGHPRGGGALMAHVPYTDLVTQYETHDLETAVVQSSTPNRDLFSLRFQVTDQHRQRIYLSTDQLVDLVTKAVALLTLEHPRRVRTLLDDTEVDLAANHPTYARGYEEVD